MDYNLQLDKEKVRVLIGEDLIFIFQTIALFLKHRKFVGTLSVFLEECEEKGYSLNKDNIKNSPDKSPTTKDEIKEENLKIRQKTPIKNLNPINETFIKSKTANFLKKTISTCTVEKLTYSVDDSDEQLQDYKRLKEKFLLLKNEQKELLDELETVGQKWGFIISSEISISKHKKDILFDNQHVEHDDTVDNVINEGDLTVESASSMKTFICEKEKNLTHPNEFERPCITSPKQKKEQSDVGHWKNDKEPLSFQTVNENVHQIEQAKFLFTRNKSHQIHSAPNQKLLKNSKDKKINETLSMPISPKKHNNTINYFPLNYTLLKKELVFGNLDEKLLILQALRWRLTRCSEDERNYNINSYTTNDLFDLKNERTLLEKLFNEYKEKADLIDALSRLINAVASLKEGRNYLCSSNKVLEMNVIPKVKQELEKSEGIRNFVEILIVVLQKLSIRRKQRTIMIKEGLLQSVSNLLSKRRDELTTYCLEYSCALFMNLCLDEEAKNECAKNPSAIIKVFVCLLKGIHNSSVNYMPYITGALYSILSEKSVKKEAIKYNIDQMILEHLKGTKDIYMVKQLEFIIRSRFKGEDANFVCNEIEPIEEIDMLDPEIDQKDSVIGSTQGELFLKTFMLKKEKPSQSSSFEEKIFENFKQKRSSAPVMKSNIECPAIGSIWSSDSNISCNNSFMYSSKDKTNSNFCDCKNSKKYYCDCYESIKRSIDDDSKSQNDLKERKIKTIKRTKHIDTPENLLGISKEIKQNRMKACSQVFLDISDMIENNCGCVSSAKYNCGCYEAIKKSVEDDTDINGELDSQTQDFSKSPKKFEQTTLFPANGNQNSKNNQS